MKIKIIETEKLKPYDRNPRHIPPEAVVSVANSIREFGFRQPILVDKNLIVIAGHTRLQAARQLGLKTVPVHIAIDLTPEQAKGLRLADNKTAEKTSWNTNELNRELAALQAVSAELCEAAGFPLEIEAAAQAINEEQPHDGEQAESDRRQEKAERLAATVEKVKSAVANKPTVSAVVIPLEGGNAAFILADPCFKDFIAEIKRAADTGENSPLSAILKEHYPL